MDDDSNGDPWGDPPLGQPGGSRDSGGPRYQLDRSMAGRRGAPAGPTWDFMTAMALARRAGPAPRFHGRTRAQIRFWGPLRGGPRHEMVTVAPATPAAGVPGGARPWRMARGVVWVQMSSTFDVALLPDDAASSDIMSAAPALFFSKGARFLPRADMHDTLFARSAPVRHYWASLNQSDSTFAISAGALVVVPPAGAYPASIGAPGRPPPPSAYLRVGRGELVDALRGVDGLAPSSVDGATSVRDCVPVWFLARYGDDVAAAQAGRHPVTGTSVGPGGGAVQRRFVTAGGRPVFEPSMDGLHRFWFGTPYVPGGDVLVTLAQLRALFVAIQTRLVVLGPGDVRLQGVEVAASRLRVAAVLVAGGHLYPLSAEDTPRLWHAQGARPAALPREYDTPLARADPAALFDAGAALPRLEIRPLAPPKPVPRFGASDAPGWLDRVADLLDAKLGTRAPEQWRGRGAETRDAFTGPWASDIAHVLWTAVVAGIGVDVVLRDGALIGVTVRVGVSAVDPGRADALAAPAVSKRRASVSTARRRAVDGDDGGGAEERGGRARASLADVDAALVTLRALPTPRGEPARAELSTAEAYAAAVAATAGLEAAWFTRGTVSSYASPDVAALLALPLVADVGDDDADAAHDAAMRAWQDADAEGRAALPPPSTIAVDQNLAYTAAAYRYLSGGRGVFNEWDAKRDYHPGEATQVHAWYFIEVSGLPRLCPLAVLLPFRVTAIRGFALDGAMADPDFARHARVRYVLPPGRVVPSGLPEKIVALWGALPRPVRRDVVNFTVGRAGRLRSRAEQTRTFATQEEAVLWCRQAAPVDGVARGDPVPLYPPGAGVGAAPEVLALYGDVAPDAPPGSPDEAPAVGAAPDPRAAYRGHDPLWTVTSTAETALTAGWAVEHRAIVKEAQWVLYQEARRRAGAGAVLLGIKTDALFYERGLEADVPKTDDVGAVLRGAFSISAGVPPRSRGGAPSADAPQWILRRAEREAAAFDAALAPAASVPVTLLSVIDESSVGGEAELFSILDAGPANVVAVYPGAGKSTLLKRWALDRGHVIEFITFTNALVAAFRADDFRARTVHRFLGMRGGDDGGAYGYPAAKATRVAEGVRARGVDVVVVDEAAFLSPDVLSVLGAVAAAGASLEPPLRFYATSDVAQLGPILDSPRASDYDDMDYTTSMLRRLWPREVVLHGIRRANSIQGAARVRELTAAIWGPPAARAAGVRLVFSVEVREAVLVSLRGLPAVWPAGLRAITHRRVTAAAWAAVLPPTLADGTSPGGRVSRPPGTFELDEVVRCVRRTPVDVPGGSVVFMPQMEYVVVEGGGRGEPLVVTPRYPDDTWRPRAAAADGGGDPNDVVEGADAGAAAPAPFEDDLDDGDAHEAWTASLASPPDWLVPASSTTTHSSQGYSLRTPIVIDVGDIRALPLREARRLLYTALTRAEDPLSVFGADVHEI
jgi:hypothetical protein